MIINLRIGADLTGSMEPCFRQVQREIEQFVREMLADIPGVRISLAGQKDYCDEEDTFLYQETPFLTDGAKLRNFAAGLRGGGGGDAPEAYEYTLYRAEQTKWGEGEKILILIGDEIPHEPNYPGNRLKLNWRTLAQKLKKMGVKVFTVQCLGNRHATPFYRELAEITGGMHMTLDQFRYISVLIRGIVYKSAGPLAFAKFEEWVRKDNRGVLTYGVKHIVSTLSGRTPVEVNGDSDLPDDLSGYNLEVVPRGRFQTFLVEDDPETGNRPSIRDFVRSRGIKFEKGNGYYPHVSRPEEIQGYKNLVLEKLSNGRFYMDPEESSPEIRRLLGLTLSPAAKETVRQNPKPGYRLWVQSTSVNRKLREPDFMYKVSDISNFDEEVA